MYQLFLLKCPVSRRPITRVVIRLLLLVCSVVIGTLQRLAGNLKFCMYEAWLLHNYAFQKGNNKSADKTAQAGLQHCYWYTAKASSCMMLTYYTIILFTKQITKVLIRAVLHLCYSHTRKAKKFSGPE